MTDAVLVEVAKAIRVELDGGEFSQDFTAERNYADWDTELESLDALKVDVVPGTFRTEQLTQKLTNYICIVEIGIRKKFDTESLTSEGKVDNLEVDQLLYLFQQMAEFWGVDQPTKGGRALTDLPEAVYQQEDSRIRFAFHPKHLRQMSQYTGILQIAYKVPKAI